MKKRALLHASNNTGIVDFAGFLFAKGYELIGAGSTYKLLIENKVPVLNVYELTGHREILSGKINTLHPNIYGGILANRGNENDLTEILDHNIGLIDLVVCNMYSVKGEILNEAPHEDIIEAISVERSSLIRASAKNYAFVTTVVDPLDYYKVLSDLEEEGEIRKETRKILAAKAFRYTASYDAVAATYLTEEEYPEKLTLSYEKVRETIYGENPHQTGAIYEEVAPKRFIASAERLQGDEPNFNNTNDADLALSLVSEFLEPTAVFVKHLNPIAVSSNKDLSISAGHFTKETVYGGIIAFNRAFTPPCAEKIKDSKIDLVLAPSFEKEALEILKENKKLIVLSIETSYKMRSKKIFGIEGGLLIQEPDINHNIDLNVVTTREPSKEEVDSCLFAETIAKYAKSTAVIITDGKRTLGIGTGQANRKKALRMAFSEAGLLSRGAVMALDSYIGEIETIKEASERGITCIIQPGNFIDSDEIVKACNEYGISMIFSGVRHFRH